MTSESTGFKAAQFFFSAKGRLNRQPYIITIIILTVLPLAITHFVIRKYICPTTLSAVQKDVQDSTEQKLKDVEKRLKEIDADPLNKDIDTEPFKKAIKSAKFFPLEIDAFNKYVDQCLKETSFMNPKILIPIFGLLVLWLLGICPAIKRLHDRGKSGWWYLGFLITGMIPIVGIAALIWFFLETWFLRGTLGPNDYGPDPLVES